MNIKSGLEIVRMHKEYKDRIEELKSAAEKLEGYGYTKAVIEEQRNRLNADLTALEDTRFQALEPVVVAKSSLGGTAKQAPEH